MVRCLFAIEDLIPLTPNFTGGASALAYSHLELLAHAGVEVYLVIFCRELPSSRFQAYIERHTSAWNQVKDWCVTHQLFRLDYIPKQSAPIQNLIRLIIDPSVPSTQVTEDTKTRLADAIAQVKPDLIWAEDSSLTSLFQAFFPEYNVVYSHHDWKWKIKRLRHHSQTNKPTYSLRRSIKYRLMRRHEELLVREVLGCVSASVSELEDMCRLGAKRIGYFPTLYDPQSAPSESIRNQGSIVHLGGMQTTANRVGLKRFLKISWPIIEAHFESSPPLWVIGSLEGADSELHELLSSSRAVCTGFVEDLSTVLRPYDLHIVPWEHNTGTRTRIPLVLSYGQVLITTYNAAACLSELQHGHDAVMVSNLHEMAQAICQLLPDQDRRKQIGQSAFKTFTRNYTREAVQGRFNEFLKRLLQ